MTSYARKVTTELARMGRGEEGGKGGGRGEGSLGHVVVVRGGVWGGRGRGGRRVEGVGGNQGGLPSLPQRPTAAAS